MTLDDVVVECERQDAKWGEQDHLDGTGQEAQPLLALTDTILDEDKACVIRDMLRSRTDWRFSGDPYRDRDGTWTDILLEEVFEALAEDDPDRLYAELVQVAAVAVQWGEAIKRRGTTERVKE